MVQGYPMVDAIREFMTRAALPIIIARGAEEEYKFGTGTIFCFSNRYYVITADHVLEDDDLEYASSPLSRENGLMMTWGDISRVNYNSILDLDISVVEIKTHETICALIKNYQVLTPDQVGSPAVGGDHWVVGFPAELARVTPEVITQTPFCIQTKMLAQTPDIPINAKPADARVDLFFQLDSEGMRDDGLTHKVPRLDGVSGASIWEISDYQGALWTAGKALKIIGVEKAAKVGSYIRATRWEHVLPLIYQLDQNP